MGGREQHRRKAGRWTGGGGGLEGRSPRVEVEVSVTAVGRVFFMTDLEA